MTATKATKLAPPPSDTLIIYLDRYIPSQNLLHLSNTKVNTTDILMLSDETAKQFDEAGEN